MNNRIGSSIKNHFFLERKGWDYSNSSNVNQMRMRILEAVPATNIKSFSMTHWDNNTPADSPNGFCVIQKSDQDVPVFMLPATSTMTKKMSDEERILFMKQLFDRCYNIYAAKTPNPVFKRYCAASIVAGTKTMWGSDHFTAMVKPAGDNNWWHVDPTGFGGPQKFNRAQCGGYSSMIEAEALIHYSSKTISEARQDSLQNVVVRYIDQFIDTLKFKFNTWFAGSRNEVLLNEKGDEVPRLTFVTSYAEMADFSAGRVAHEFDNNAFINDRMQP